jgi:hypothetical protein
VQQGGRLCEGEGRVRLAAAETAVKGNDTTFNFKSRERYMIYVRLLKNEKKKNQLAPETFTLSTFAPSYPRLLTRERVL